MMNARVILNKLIELTGFKAVLLVIGIGGLSSLAFPPTYCIPILLFTFPLLLLRIDQATSWKKAFAQGYWFGFGLHTVGLSWLVNAILIRAQDFWWLVPIVSPLCAILLAFWTGLVGALYYWIRPSGWRKIFVFAGLWTLCDMSRAILLSPSWWNPVLTGFPWNPLGSAWEIPGYVGDILIQPAAWVGVDGLTLFTVLLVLLPIYGCKGWVSLIVAMICWVGAGWVRLSPAPVAQQDTPIVALIQGNIAEDDKINNTDPRRIFQNYLSLTKEGMQKALQLQKQQVIPNRPVLFAWPESSFPGDIAYDSVARTVLMQQAKGAAAGILGAITRDEQGHIHNSLVVLKPEDGAIIAQYDKAKLVPFGESQPWYIPFHIVPGSPLTPGKGVETIPLAGVSSFGPLICYEVIFSGQVIDSSHRPKWLLNLTNDAWYGNSAGPRQHLAAVRLRAVEEGIPIVRVANTGISAVFDPYGREMVRIGWGIRADKAVALPGSLSGTLFSHVGRWIPFIISMIYVLFGIIFPNYKKRMLPTTEA
ncbi:Apolipoprotein N-acyltransferase (Lnt) (PDB:6NWR) [Commensalibacter communis]|uniref:Apolipoprotein N-acyltransferase n=1 Tax=Commensalibacter communis TaxID=2972786 RepID=A0A9W4XAA5_9PROT|nr:apolipoprotein N-acyltransferase [Commensalibacter communis]CAI3948768.1 Apolipoprotein N-acyltransferase (Lnt) (PDB:6NWR) [Commensalibacter communis]CAI3951094.1 Apolipoprotein N-acyltransferase (Lnt) (PDB:6NWR) [Commensalibacter communis]CAI3951908.1 Apolipoprotein N-acyltransferase (Lnt) (PDB:6NWR) [Commensalibacter communis]CAI3952714.1 Apolipoprotein N-acyltransferase (Lnt) (PDB:6NWR) [Commensalibacter communis]CAI3953059.1 Apolipoprotein N-acyltransferase (Lnt) (PDB:6NWR) [Commensalib